MKVCVLGGGRQGKVIATDLAAHAEVTVVDAVRVNVPGTSPAEADLSDYDTVVRVISEYDLAVGSLPARLGFQAARAAAEAGKNYVDVAFYPEDAGRLHDEAKAAGVAIVPDCGASPGISNLLIGRQLAEGTPDELHIKVGGFARDPSKPYGYVVTWSIDDLQDEYTRPARIVRGGKRVVVPALSGVRKIEVEGVGELEAFFTDGLRTLLDCGIPEMTEMTLRWPGHADQVRPLVRTERLVEELRMKCTEGEDIVVLLVDMHRGGRRLRHSLIDVPQGGLSAMARTTALTTAAFARLAISGGLQETGVVPPEKIGRDEKAFKFIMDALTENSVVVRTSEA